MVIRNWNIRKRKILADWELSLDTLRSNWETQPELWHLNLASRVPWPAEVISSSAFCWYRLYLLLSFFCWYYGHMGLGKENVQNCILERCRRAFTSQLPLQQQRKGVQVELRGGQNQSTHKLLVSAHETNKIKIQVGSERWFHRRKVLREVQQSHPEKVSLSQVEMFCSL